MGQEAIDWGLFGMFMWALFALLPRRRRRERMRRLGMLRPPDYAPPAPPPPVPTPPAPSPPAIPAAPRLPVDVELKVDQIKRKVEFLLQHAGKFPTGSEDLFVLQRTASDYLPATVDAYLELRSETTAETTAPDGRTAVEVLKDQLGLLDSKLDEIAEDLQRENFDRLLANGRFLEERFGHRASQD
jgi:hypothetical protein